MMHKLYIVINLNKDKEKADEKRANFRLAKTKQKNTQTYTHTYTHRQTERKSVRETKKTK